jgi:HlyD family secretion protein
MKKASIYCVLLFFALCLSGCKKDGKKPFFVGVKKENFLYEIPMSGEIFSTVSSSLICPNGVGGVITRMAESGSAVKKGDVLIEVESESLRERMTREKSRLEQNKRRLEQTRQRLEKEKLESELDVLEKTHALVIKEKEIYYAFGERNEKVLQTIDLKMKVLQDSIAFSKTKLASYKQLAEARSISIEELERMKKDLAKTELSLELEKIEKALKIRGSSQKEKEKLLVEKDILVRDLALAKAGLAAKEQVWPLELEKMELVVQKAAKDIEKTEALLDKTRLKAAQDGVYVPVKSPWEDDYFSVGQNVWRGVEIGKVINRNNLAARIRVPEKYADTVKGGMIIKLRSVFSGSLDTEAKISRVESFATPLNPVDSKSVRFYWAHVDLSSPELFIPGETVEGRLVVGEFTSVGRVPKELSRRNTDALTGEADIEIVTEKGKQNFVRVAETEDFFLVDLSTTGDLQVLCAFD